MSAIYPRVALIGLGLIASSMFWAMRRQPGLADHVVGYARSAATRDTARRIGLCDSVCDSIAEAVKDADLVVLAVPVGVMGPVAAEMAPYLKPGATVTDVGSVKRQVIADVAPHLPDGVHFVPAHPIAGTEHSGPESGFDSLFDNRWCLLVLVDGTPNKDATLELLGRFTEELFALQRAIRKGDGDHLHAYFTRTRAIRRGIIEAGQDTSAPNFGRGATK